MIHWSGKREHQKRRYQLLSICRSFYPLLKQLLYTEVTIHHYLQMSKLLSIMSDGRSQEDTGAKYIKSLFFDVPSQGKLNSRINTSFRSSSVPHSTDISIFTICPNLEYLHLSRVIFNKKYDASSLFTHRADRLWQLTLDGQVCDPNKLSMISACAPNLVQLNITTERFGHQVEQLAFPSLQILKFHILYYNITVYPRMECSSLRHLCLNVTMAAQSVSAVQEYGPRIEELELWAVDSYTTLPKNLFNVCGLLKKLTFRIDTTHISPDITIIRNTSLEALTLFMFALECSPKIEERLRFFSPKRFINLTSVIIHANHIDNQEHLPALYALLLDIFPDINSTVRVGE